MRDDEDQERLQGIPVSYTHLHVKAPGIKESPVNLECRVVDVKELGSHDMFIAKVMGVTVDGKYMNDKGKFNLNASGLVCYSHGEYFEMGKRLGTFGYSAVSYTHLDVYKRQLQFRPHPYNSLLYWLFRLRSMSGVRLLPLRMRKELHYIPWKWTRLQALFYCSALSTGRW